MAYNFKRKSEGDIRRRLQPTSTSTSTGNTTSPSDFSDDTGDEREFAASSGPGSGSVLTTHIVMCIESRTKPEALRWLVDKMRGKRDEGGAELIVRQQIENVEKGQDYILHVSASKIKLLEAAEYLELQKKDKYGRLRDFTVGNLEDFLLDESMSVDDLLTTSEKQTIVKHELDNIRATSQDHFIPGYSSCKLYEGQSVMQVCIENNIVAQVYPLHEKELLKRLGKTWYQTFSNRQPIEEIRLYFGEGIALYFSFLGFYTIALIVPMILGFIQLLLNSTESVPFFCVFNVVWTTIFLEMWKRKSNELAFNWGTIGMTSLDEPRANYHGVMAKDPVSGKIRPQYPRWKTNAKMYLVSLPIVFICMVLAFIIMLISFWCEEYVKTIESEYRTQLEQLPSILYAILVYIMNMYYRQFATFLTEWENHRTQSQYDRHRVTKLVLFEFVNNFLSLFYIAFIIQDLDMLKWQLSVMLIIQQSFNHIQEAFLPLGVRRFLQKIAHFKRTIFSVNSKRKKYSFNANDAISSVEIFKHSIPVTEDECKAAQKQSTMDHYEGTFDDYLELFVQFGYVVLFSSVYPIAAFWAVVNNLIEVRLDAFKLCKVYQRPMARKVKDIGAWQRAFEIVGALSIMTNLGVLALSPVIQTTFGLIPTTAATDPDTETVAETATQVSREMWIFAFVTIEHILLGVRFLLHKAIPDRPEWVRIQLARNMYESRKVLKYERIQKNAKLLTRRFKTVHGPHKKN